MESETGVEERLTSPSDAQDTQPGELLIPEETYLTSGVHIGTQQKSASMRRFVFKVRFDGLHVLDIRETDRRIRIAAKFLASFPPDQVLAVSQRQYGQKPVKVFARATGAVSFSERFVPGCLTNPNLEEYYEPKALLVTDPATDQQALSEAVSIGIPVVGLCDVNNETRHVDLVIPANNKGRVALATVYWLLAREVIRSRSGPEAPYELTIEDFQAAL
jgi:small subunit ribosomal protein S2